MSHSNLLIAFTRRSNKFWARVFCRHFRHCVVLFPACDAIPHLRGLPDSAVKYILVQIGIDGIRLFAVDARAMRRMKRAGWVFVEIKNGKLKMKNERLKIGTHKIFNFQFLTFNFLSCVGFAKRAIGIRALFIWTPDKLYKKIRRNGGFF